MIDINFVREHADLVKMNTKNKGYDVDIDALLQADATRKDLQKQVEELRAERNTHASGLKTERPSDELIAKGKSIKEELSSLETKLKEIDEQFTNLLKQIPNMSTDDVPVGASEAENVVTKEVGEKPQFDFQPKSHWELAESRGWIDKERAAKVAGSRFAYIKGDLVKLQFGIIQFVLDVLTDESKLAEIAKTAGLNVSSRPFTPILPPYMIRTDLYDAMDRLEPREDRYKIEDEELWLQGSAEHVIGSMHSGEILDKTQTPLRYIGYATSFRREAGNYGKDTEGIFRMHQFDKLELESITTAEDGLDEHLFLVAIQEYLLNQLGLPYRVVQKCTADIGKPNARGIDMETWLPSQNAYRETHTADYMTDYQARRLNTRIREATGTELAYTNDATAFALGRIMIAIIENYQTAESNVTVPTALQPYLNGRNSL